MFNRPLLKLTKLMDCALDTLSVPPVSDTGPLPSELAAPSLTVALAMVKPLIGCAALTLSTPPATDTVPVPMPRPRWR